MTFKRGRPTFNRANGFRSGLEDSVNKQCMKMGIKYSYEQHKISYTIPESVHKYTPDFILEENGIIIETKGQFKLDDRKKHKWIQLQYPDLDIRFVFTNPLGKIRKGSPTSYAQWATKEGFKYAKKLIPVEWFSEPPNLKSLEAIEALYKK
ncbi:MAG: endonuclease I [Alphaproteobacteria bacterium]|nr:MAG: endonuclease I [Alphaproteobacteria bacterium]